MSSEWETASKAWSRCYQEEALEELRRTVAFASRVAVDRMGDNVDRAMLNYGQDNDTHYTTTTWTDSGTGYSVETGDDADLLPRVVLGWSVDDEPESAPARPTPPAIPPAGRRRLVL